jgi:hypothetical protein
VSRIDHNECGVVEDKGLAGGGEKAEEEAEVERKGSSVSIDVTEAEVDMGNPLVRGSGG